MNYKNALKVLNLDKLHERRKKICLNFAKNCLKNDKVKDLFPKNDQTRKMNLRKQRKDKIKKIRTERYKKSALPYIIKISASKYASVMLKSKDDKRPFL